MTTRASRIVLFEPDLLFSSQIEGLASRSGLEVTVVTNLEELLHELDAKSAKAFIISLDSLEGQLLVLRTHVYETMSVVGYYSHVKGHLAKEAKSAGIRTVISRGAFAAKMQEVLAGLG